MDYPFSQLQQPVKGLNLLFSTHCHKNCHGLNVCATPHAQKSYVEVLTPNGMVLRDEAFGR